MKTLIAKSLLILGSSTLLMSCMGQSSTPMKQYSNLRTGMPTTEQSETQKTALPVFTSADVPGSMSDFSDILIQGTNEVNTAAFMEGQEGILYFKLAPKSTKILTYKLDITDFSVASRPTLIATKAPHIHALRWTPPNGIIPSGRSSIALKLQLQATVLESSDPNLRGLINSDTITIYVERLSSEPKIIGKSKLPVSIEEGQAPIAYSIDIVDPASVSSPKMPDVRIAPYKYSNTEAFRADGSRYVILDTSKSVNPEKIAGTPGAWRFHYIIDVDSLPLDRDRRGIENPLAPSVDVCFHVQAISVLVTASTQEQLCFKGLYAAQLPALTWENDQLKEVKGGATTALNFSIQSTNGLGQVSIKNAATQIAGLTGKKELTCSAVAGNQALQSCVLTWTPTCVNAPLNKKLTLKVDNVTGKKSKSESFVKDFVVIPSEEHCPKPAAKPAAVPAKPADKPAATTAKPAAKPVVQPTTGAK